MRAAIYVRVSTSRQAERDLSLPDQVTQCRAYCERRGWEVVEVFSEPGASALDEDRPAFQEMIARATRPEKPFQFVVVHSLSRFSRDTLHSELYIRRLAKVGVQLISITQDVGSDASGEFIRKILSVFDEHQSRENAKHVHRAMLENARQGFWNGSKPPFGYGLTITERRGNRDKKVLVIDEAEARIVRTIFNMAMGKNGHPAGVKAIAVHLNERGYTRRGHRFSTGSIHDILTTTTYHGQHWSNRFDSRNCAPRPPSQWVGMDVPAIIDETVFNAVRSLLQSRDPRRLPPRVANGPTLLAGIARCGHCGAALIQNTGKGGAYRYYCCSSRLKQGPMACEGLRMPMDRLDGIVIGEVSKRILAPDRLTELLDSYSREAIERGDDQRKQLTRLRSSHSDAEAGISRLLELVEKGVMGAEDQSLR
jgi:site-specific DNA recombinase